MGLARRQTVDRYRYDMYVRTEEGQTALLNREVERCYSKRKRQRKEHIIDIHQGFAFFTS